MDDKVENTSQLFIIGGMCGVVSIILYILVITVPFSPAITFALAMLWPLMSIAYAYALYRLIAQEREGALNRLSFIFACLGFTIVAEMLSIQLAVGAGVDKFLSDSGADPEFWAAVRKGLRLIDLGLDVAWDLFIGTSLVLGAIPMSFHSKLGLWWSIPSAVFGLLVIGLNAVTFPWPPDTSGLFDIGPFIGLYIIALASRVTMLGLRLRKQSLP